jgi:hypothetical protein
MSESLYAEKLLIDAGHDVYFVQFFVDHPEFNLLCIEAHLSWFDSELVIHAPAKTIDDEDDGVANLIVVGFDPVDDDRLGKYSAHFEDEHGVSLDPASYQLVRWSYDAWVADGGDVKFKGQMKTI